MCTARLTSKPMTEQTDSFDAWLHTPPGRYLLQWEQAQLDRAVADIFGYHAVQLGVSALDGLRMNRMPHRWLAADTLSAAPTPLAAASGAVADESLQGAGASHLPLITTSPHLVCRFDALPFKTASIDLVVMPHALEMAHDPHETLREVERVLVPDGRVVFCGFNNASLWGMKQRMGRLRQRLGSVQPLYVPRQTEFIGYRRLRDWLRLMSLEIERGRFGCYAPAVTSDAWLQRMRWMDKTGDRWWPVFGAVYFLVAVKRVRGMRMVGLARREHVKVGASPAVATHRTPKALHEDIEQQ